ncbi:MAG TPA: hypothetical protein VFQ50_06675 [Flavobacterium sp.]|jgi:hypothetical protein|nr:hypothetical protein [Flavobacterium sp.]
MKHFFIAAFALLSLSMNAQKPCDLAADVKDSIGTYKETRDQLVYERNFGGTSSYVFFSLVKTDGMPTLNVQFIDKSKDFIKAKCLDKNSKMYLQLDNGKIVTLLHIDSENCGSTVRDDKQNNNRIMNGIFMFIKGTFEDLKKSPVSVMRIRYATDTVDYIIRPEFQSEMDGKTYSPATYFVDTLHCLEI